MGFISGLVVLAGVGMIGRVSKTGVMKLLGDSGSLGVWTVLTGLGVLVLWVVDNLSGLFMGWSASMGYGLVMMLSTSLWTWSELTKLASKGAVSYYAHFSIMGVSGGLGVVLPFMEFLSIVIRPLTLGVRLSTNITSGHVLLAMVGVLGVSGSVWGVFVLSTGWLLGALEVFVSILQGSIFSLLVMIYLE
uniref:ATP synthase subunit a n=1 Tax=Centrorhynchus clitorideus TaxID=2731796 RepID=A0A6M3YWN2_9BILA|nr:ATP synthase F0 subunit 6 [Centrorhynchus clitorideus]